MMGMVGWCLRNEKVFDAELKGVLDLCYRSLPPSGGHSVAALSAVIIHGVETRNEGEARGKPFRLYQGQLQH